MSQCDTNRCHKTVHKHVQMSQNHIQMPQFNGNTEYTLNNCMNFLPICMLFVATTKILLAPHNLICDSQTYGCCQPHSTSSFSACMAQSKADVADLMISCFLQLNAYKSSVIHRSTTSGFSWIPPVPVNITVN